MKGYFSIQPGGDPCPLLSLAYREFGDPDNRRANMGLARIPPNLLESNDDFQAQRKRRRPMEHLGCRRANEVAEVMPG